MSIKSHYIDFKLMSSSTSDKRGSQLNKLDDGEFSFLNLKVKLRHTLVNIIDPRGKAGRKWE